MNYLSLKNTPLYLALFLTLFFGELAEAKRFQRALVLGGGGVSPAVALGIIKGLEDQGWTPDVIITTCGSSVAAALLSAYKTNEAALEYEQSTEFQEVLGNLKIKTVSALKMKRTFDQLRNAPGVFPDFFNDTVLEFPESGKSSLPETQFSSTPGLPRFIMVAARANFDQKSVGTEGTHPQFTETYFTDADTALSLVHFRSPIKTIFPKSYLQDFTDVITNRTVGEAARASIADPFLINPGHLGKDYYFTGAVDLVPLGLAHELADQIISTSNGNFKSYEDDAVESAFGFRQSDAAARSLNDQSVTFIPPLFVGKRSFDPKPFLLWFHSRVPKRFRRFARKLQAQYDYGYRQVDEVVPRHE